MKNLISAGTENESALLQQLAVARAETDALFDIVLPEALYERPIPERHRLIFYLGHLEAFDWNLIGRGGCSSPPVNAELDARFAFGIDPVEGGLPQDQPADWPDLESVRDYVRRARAALDGCLQSVASCGGMQAARFEELLDVALEHRLMHAETLAYLLHQLPYALKRPQYEPPRPRHGPAFAAAVAPIPLGTATLGQSRGPGRFGWDNEFDAVPVPVPAFYIETRDVTNGAFLEFVRAGGYENPELWTPSAWNWRAQHGRQHPGFWVRRGRRWMVRGMFEEMPLALDLPVYVSHAEAAAYARWRGGSLPSEAQFHRAAYGSPEGCEAPYPWGDTPPAPQYGNFDLLRWDPVAVGTYPASDSAFGIADLVGNGWEWTSTPFQPLPGFEPMPFYRGYSANFFDGRHYVLKGGGPRTAARLLRRSFRNWFQPHYPYVHATFRCVFEAR